MFININKKKISYFLLNVSKTCQDELTTPRNIENECLSHPCQNIFFQELEAFQTTYLSIINYLQLFFIFPIFIFMLVSFQLTLL